MAYKDPQDKTNYMREYMRRRRSAEAGGGELDQDGEANEHERWRTFRLKEAEDLRKIVERAIELLDNADVDPVVKARAVFQGAEIGIKLLKLTELTKQVKELQADRVRDEAES